MEKEFVEYIAKSLVDDPDSVEVNEVTGIKSLILELKVAPDDVGKIIGREGRIAVSIRALLGAMSTRSNRRVTLHIIDD